MPIQDLSNEELIQIVNQQNNINNDITQLSDDELRQIAGIQKPDVLSDIGRSALSGLTEIPRAAANFSNEYLRPFIGKEKLSSEQLQAALSKAGMAEYKPQTAAGNVTGFAGSIAPALLLPEAKLVQGAGLGSKILNQSLTGAYQGGLISGVGAINNGQNPMEEMYKGVGLGTLFGATLPTSGAVFEKIMPNVSQFMSGIPKEDFTRALDSIKNNNSIFKGAYKPSEQYSNLGDKAQEAINYLKKTAGQAQGREVESIRNSNVLMDTNELSDKIKNLIASKNYGGVQTLDTGDQRALNDIADILNNHENILSAEQIYGLKKRIQNNYQSFDLNKVKLTTGEGDYIINQITSALDDMLVNRFPEFAKTKADYANIMKLQEHLGNKLKDVNIGNALKTMNTEKNTTSGYPELFQQLNDLSPENLQFMDEVKNLQTREQFEQFHPHWNELRGNVGGHVGLASAGAMLTHGNPVFLTPAFLSVPKLEKALLETYDTGIKSSPYYNRLIQELMNFSRSNNNETK